MKICHISTVHPMFDNRIFYKECISLANSGFEVHLIITHDKEEVINNVHIIPLSQNEGRINRLFVKQWEALDKALSVKADIYHFHDPELIFIGGILKLFGKKVIYDVHEDVPLQILNKDWLGNLFTRKIIANIFNSIEKWFAKKYDGIVTVTLDIVNKFNMNKNTILLSNFPVVSLINKAEYANVKKDNIVLIYAGGLTKIRGIKELIQTVELLNGQAELWLLGKWESEDFKDECTNLGGWQNTRYLGVKPMDEVYLYMKMADIGMCTLYPTKNYLNSWPVKAFEYMACEIPIIMSNFPYWMEKFKNSAIFCNPKSPEDIAQAVKSILDHKDLALEIKKKNKVLVQTIYSWEAESRKLIELYRKIIGKVV